MKIVDKLNILSSSIDVWSQAIIFIVLFSRIMNYLNVLAVPKPLPSPRSLPLELPPSSLTLPPLTPLVPQNHQLHQAALLVSNIMKYMALFLPIFNPFPNKMELERNSQTKSFPFIEVKSIRLCWRVFGV